MKTAREIELELTENSKRMLMVIQASKRQAALLAEEVSIPVSSLGAGLESPPDLAGKAER